MDGLILLTYYKNYPISTLKTVMNHTASLPLVFSYYLKNNAIPTLSQTGWYGTFHLLRILSTIKEKQLKVYELRWVTIVSIVSILTKATMRLALSFTERLDPFHWFLVLYHLKIKHVYVSLRYNTVCIFAYSLNTRSRQTLHLKRKMVMLHTASIPFVCCVFSLQSTTRLNSVFNWQPGHFHWLRPSLITELIHSYAPHHFITIFIFCIFITYSFTKWTLNITWRFPYIMIPFHEIYLFTYDYAFRWL